MIKNTLDTSAPSPGAGFGMNGGEIIPNSYPITSVGVNHPVQVRVIRIITQYNLYKNTNIFLF